MSVARVFGEARQIGDRIGYNPDEWLDVPAGATHVLVRPVRRGDNCKVIVAFFRAGLLCDYKPQNSAGKFFCRPDGAKKCRVGAWSRHSGWCYNVEWLT